MEETLKIVAEVWRESKSRSKSSIFSCLIFAFVSFNFKPALGLALFFDDKAKQTFIESATESFRNPEFYIWYALNIIAWAFLIPVINISLGHLRYIALERRLIVANLNARKTEAEKMREYLNIEDGIATVEKLNETIAELRKTNAALQEENRNVKQSNLAMSVTNQQNTTRIQEQDSIIKGASSVYGIQSPLESIEKLLNEFWGPHKRIRNILSSGNPNVSRENLIAEIHKVGDSHDEIKRIIQDIYQQIANIRSMLNPTDPRLPYPKISTMEVANPPPGTV